jgi:hypothetical protein
MASFDMALVDEIRQRLNASYEEALVGLEESDGDLLHALAAIERRRREREDALESGELIGRAVGLAREGKLRGLEVKLGERVVRQLPLPKSVAGAMLGVVLSTVLSQLSVDLVTKQPGEPAEEQEPALETEAEEAG